MREGVRISRGRICRISGMERPGGADGAVAGASYVYFQSGK